MLERRLVTTTENFPVSRKLGNSGQQPTAKTHQGNQRERRQESNNHLILRRCQPCESRELANWIKQHHYLKSSPPGYRVALEFLEGRRRVGGMLLGIPSNRHLDPERILELTRMYFVEDAPKNTESRALAMMRSWVRKWMPAVRLLVAYSDPLQGHNGTVYAADGWAPFGMTRPAKGYGWASQLDRNRIVGKKLRWVRTP